MPYSKQLFVFGGAALNNCDADIVNCTIVSNTTSSKAGVLRSCDGNVVNCIIWCNSTTELYECNAVVSYSCVEGGVEGKGNIDADPMFMMEGYWDDSGTPVMNGMISGLRVIIILDGIRHVLIGGIRSMCRKRMKRI